MTQPLSPLVLRFGAFGDMILMIPVLKLLQQRFGAPCDIVSSGPWTEPLLQRVPAAGERFYLTSRRAPYWFNRSQQNFVRWLRARPAGPVYVFEPDEKPLALLRRAGVAPDWVCTLRDHPRQPAEHILAHMFRLARQTPRALGASFPAAPAGNPDARPALTETDRRDVSEWIAARGLADAPLVLLQPGNKKTMKGGRRQRASNVDYWPEENWARVIDGVLAAAPLARVVVCGSPSERPLADDILARVATSAARVVIATDDLPIPRLLALQERAHSMISANTGPAHGAAAMGCPLLVMFSRHAHRAADLYVPVATTAPVKVLLPDSLAPDAAVALIPPSAVIAAWRELARA
ncbi:MAG TPA: glycosyltransferase family 9 protein [Opitutus sp.]|nr:glycosyltransferase family 9 protein [Opitutus sp.]